MMSPVSGVQGVARSLAVRDRRTSRGQVLIVFATSILLFLLLCAAVVDMSWYWTNNLRMQRAADAAALAGVVFLPGDPSTAITVARAEAAKNGYTNGTGGVTVTPVQDPSNVRRLNVTISGPVGTYFARTVGITSWPARRVATADYVLPVPMGSPDPYYGVGYLIKPVTTTTTSTSTATSNANSGFLVATTTPGTVTWTASSGTLVASPNSNNNVYAQTSTTNAAQQWGSFSLSPTLPSNQVISAIQGIQVRLSDAFVSATCNASKIQVALSWNNGVNWTTTPAEATSLPTDTTSGDYTLGSASSLSAWPGHSWVAADLANNKFIVRLTAVKGCVTAGTQIRLDMLEVQVNYQITTTTTTTTSTTNLQHVAVTSPSGGALTPQNFWASMQSQGSISSQGDAFMTKYETRIAGGGTGTLNAAGGSDPDARYDPNTYYNYIVEIPSGSSNGTVWIYDPGFCDGTSGGGTGEYWHVSSSGTSNPPGYINRQPISAFYDLLDTKDTPFDLTDDTAVASSGNTFKRLSLEDHVVFGLQGQSTNVSDCSALSWHYGWYQLTTGLLPGTYRLHTSSTDPVATADQNNSTGLNAFAFYASATGGSPKIYGLGAIEAYVRLPGGTSSEFYLAQIDAVHAGKTMVVNLWDAGDTSQAATVEILKPTGSGFTPATFKYKGTVGTTNTSASACGGYTGSNVTSVVTNTGSASRFNGCWLTIEIALPSNYTAPSDPVTGQPGWWKIRYNMSGTASDLSTDLTTWKVDIRGNPVHLLIP